MRTERFMGVAARARSLFSHAGALLVGEINQPPAGCPKGTASLVVEINSRCYVAGMADKEAVVSAADNVDEEGI